MAETLLPEVLFTRRVQYQFTLACRKNVDLFVKDVIFTLLGLIDVRSSLPEHIVQHVAMLTFYIGTITTFLHKDNNTIHGDIMWICHRIYLCSHWGELLSSYWQ